MFAMASMGLVGPSSDPPAGSISVSSESDPTSVGLDVFAECETESLDLPVTSSADSSISLQISACIQAMESTVANPLDCEEPQYPTPAVGSCDSELCEPVTPQQLQVEEPSTSGPVRKKGRGNQNGRPKNHPPHVVAALQKWFAEHLPRPRPTKEDATRLSNALGISRQQVLSWFCNQWKRKWTPGPTDGVKSGNSSNSPQPRVGVGAAAAPGCAGQTTDRAASVAASADPEVDLCKIFLVC